MGQGKKKNKSDPGRWVRRGSITNDKEDYGSSRTSTPMTYSSKSRRRRDSMHRGGGERRARPPTPVPDRIVSEPELKSIMTDEDILSLCSGSDSSRSSSPSREGSFCNQTTTHSPANVTIEIVTGPSAKPGFLAFSMECNHLSKISSEEYKNCCDVIADDLYVALFPCNTFVQNGKLKEISHRLMDDLHSIFVDIMVTFNINVYPEKWLHLNNTEILFYVFESNLIKIIKRIIHQSRFEKAYNCSARVALITKLFELFPSFEYQFITSLYCSLLDFEEMSRENLKPSSAEESSTERVSDGVNSYLCGHIHRLMELWNALTGLLYDRYSLALMNKAISSLYSSTILAHTQSSTQLINCFLIIIKIPQVISKYHHSLIQSILHIINMNDHALTHLLTHILNKWPKCSIERKMGLIDFMSDLLPQSLIFTNPIYTQDITSLIRCLASELYNEHSEISQRILKFLMNDCIFYAFIQQSEARVAIIKASLVFCQDNWNSTIRELSDSLFDRLLDLW